MKLSACPTVSTLHFSLWATCSVLEGNLLDCFMARNRRRALFFQSKRTQRFLSFWWQQMVEGVKDFQHGCPIQEKGSKSNKTSEKCVEVILQTKHMNQTVTSCQLWRWTLCGSFAGAEGRLTEVLSQANVNQLLYLVFCFTAQLKWIARPSDDRTSKCNSVTSLLYIMWYQIKYLCILSHVFGKTGNLKILSWAQGSYTGHVYTSIVPLGFFGVPLVTLSLFLHFSLVLFLSIQFL